MSEAFFFCCQKCMVVNLLLQNMLESESLQRYFQRLVVMQIKMYIRNLTIKHSVKIWYEHVKDLDQEISSFTVFH
jgi:hypothetical protein